MTEAERATFRAGMEHAFDVVQVALFGGPTSGMTRSGKVTVSPQPSPEWVAEKRACEASRDASLRARGYQF